MTDCPLRVKAEQFEDDDDGDLARHLQRCKKYNLAISESALRQQNGHLVLACGIVEHWNFVLLKDPDLGSRG